MKFNIFVLLFLLAGCTTLKPYENPESGSLAQLTLPSMYKDNLAGLLPWKKNYLFAIADESDCGYMYEIAESNSGEAVTYNVPADEKIFVYLYMSLGAKTCSTTGYFVAEENKEYFADGGVVVDVCVLAVTENVQGQKDPVELKGAFMADDYLGQLCVTK
ncbi:hypothetical protein [Enterovibrio norvegicus]|uniref:Lipoprotein n=1 Tax=Enterovibrio norvegicus TaxID=188144 RepID=A0A2N7LBL6_9GAMM|nr:hypothetical protein [Enterovibrio norvegicus]PMN92665.1 hypothetical protein BCT23_14395 [Enterovibrio norvegicus]